MKRCYGCKETKPLEEFYRNKSKPGGLHDSCKECTKARVNAYAAANREKVRASQRERYPARVEKYKPRREEYYQANREHIMATTRARYKAKKEEILVQQKAYAAANKEEVRARKKAYAERNSAQLRAWRARYKKENAERLRQYRLSPEAQLQARLRTHKRRALKRQNGGTFTPSQWKAKCESLGYICYLCGSQLTSATVTIDHVVPVTKGGSNYLDNVMPACRRCNRQKSNQLLEDYLERINPLCSGGSASEPVPESP